MDGLCYKDDNNAFFFYRTIYLNEKNGTSCKQTEVLYKFACKTLFAIWWRVNIREKNDLNGERWTTMTENTTYV